MLAREQAVSLEEHIARWRTYLRRRQAIHRVDVDELEDHLREQIDLLTQAGLSADEAFLVAVKRMGDLDTLSREFAREHSDRLWKQLVVDPTGGAESHTTISTDTVVAFGLAIVAAIVVKLTLYFGDDLDQTSGFYARNLSLIVLPLLTGYFAWKRQITPGTFAWMAGAFVASSVFANMYPFISGGHTESLTALHLPIALWIVVGIAYAGGRWNQVSGRMDFIRFSGELFIYYVLIALGGGVLIAFLMLMFQTIGINAERFAAQWLLPCGAAGAVMIAAWLVEAKQSVIENMAPVLTRLFTPLFAAVLVTFLGALVFTGRLAAFDRNMLIAFDLLLLLVLALLLYSLSARDPYAPPGIFDIMQVVLVVSALLADAVALWTIAERISDYGLSPNRVAVLGINVILLINLVWSAVLYIRYLTRRGTFAALERWQTDYLPIYAVWSAIVVTVFPPLFGFI